MSEEQLSALLIKLLQDTGLREKLQNAADLDSAIAIAQQAGFAMTAEELDKALEQCSELSDGELESMSGGTDVASMDIKMAMSRLGYCSKKQAARICF